MPILGNSTYGCLLYSEKVYLDSARERINMVESSKKKIKVLLSKMGLDSHDRGIIMLAKWLRDAGMEVIYLGQYQTVDNIIHSATQEDVDVIGLSFLSGEQLVYVPKVAEEMKKKGLDHSLLLVGGVIPDDDISQLKQMGADDVFVSGTPMQTIIYFIEQNVGAKV